MKSPKIIAARLTPSVPAAIATIAIRGARAVEVIHECVQLQTSRLVTGRVHYGTWQFSPEDEVAGEQLVVCRTEEDQVELHCHGGAAVVQALLESLSEHGCEVIDGDDWPSSHDCPISRQAEVDLLRTRTDRTAAILLDQLDGALADELTSIVKMLREGGAAAAERMWRLHDWAKFGAHLAHPWQVVFAGPPNAGKSSLANAITGQNCSIVHHEAGTTRDWIESHTAIHGWPVSLIDTAGLRESEDWVEGEGVRRAHERIEHADLLVVVVDATEGWTEAHTDLLARARGPVLLAWNKVDLVSDFHSPKNLAEEAQALPWVAASAIGPPGIALLLETISQMLVPRVPASGAAIPFRPEHGERLAHAISYLESGSTAEAIGELELLLVPWRHSAERA